MFIIALERLGAVLVVASVPVGAATVSGAFYSNADIIVAMLM